jgi:hypothetical protein
MTLPSNFIIIIVLILLIITAVYFLLPKLNLSRYANAFLKTSIAWAALGYIAVDKYQENNITMVVVLSIGALVFAYTAFTAKTKN